MKKKSTKNSKNAYFVSPEGRRVLSNVLRSYDVEKAGVDVAIYRIRHKKQWELLEALERDGYLRRDASHKRYFVSLIGLTQISAKPAKELLARMETIFSEFRKSYTTDPHAKVFLFDLVRRTGMRVAELRNCLEYMTEMSITSGHNICSEGVKSIEMYILPNEIVASPKYRRFRDMLVERLQNNEIQKKRLNNLNNVFVARLSKSDKQQIIPIKGVANNQQNWYRSLKPGIRKLMLEVNEGINANTRTLAAMGLRAVIDMACNDVLGDIGSFERKLLSLHEGGHITAGQKRTLGNALEIGHAAAHRGHVPNRKEIETLRDIIEHLLKQLYHHESASEKLRKGVPSRKRTIS